MNDQIYSVNDPNFWIKLSKIWPRTWPEIDDIAAALLRHFKATLTLVEEDDEFSFVTIDVAEFVSTANFTPTGAVNWAFGLMMNLKDPEIRLGSARPTQFNLRWRR